MKQINKIRLTESQLHKVIKESVKRILENYPPGAANDPRAPYNQVDDPTQEMNVTVYAYYINPETEEEREEEFNVTVEVEGYYEEYDEYTDGERWHGADFVPYDGEIERAVKDSGEIPETLEGGWVLDDIYVD